VVRRNVEDAENEMPKVLSGLDGKGMSPPSPHPIRVLCRPVSCPAGFMAEPG